MSNYHYNEGNCPNCINQSSYSSLENTKNYSCDQKCLCNIDEGRSNKDKMYYNWFVLNKPMVLPPQENQIVQPKKQNCDKNN